MKKWNCPKCKNWTSDYAAISRRDDKTKICDNCGTSEAIFDLYIYMSQEKIKKEIENEKLWLNDCKEVKK